MDVRMFVNSNVRNAYICVLGASVADDTTDIKRTLKRQQNANPSQN